MKRSTCLAVVGAIYCMYACIDLKKAQKFFEHPKCIRSTLLVYTQLRRESCNAKVHAIIQLLHTTLSHNI